MGSNAPGAFLVSIKISSWVLRFCLLAQATGHQNRSFSFFGEEQKQARRLPFAFSPVLAPLSVTQKLAVSPHNYSSFSLLSAPVSSAFELTKTPLFLSTSRIHVTLAATVSSEKII